MGREERHELSDVLRPGGPSGRRCRGAHRAHGHERWSLARSVAGVNNVVAATRGDVLMTKTIRHVRHQTTSTVGIDPEVNRESYPSHRYRDAEESSWRVTHHDRTEPPPREAAEGKWRDHRPLDGTEEDEDHRCHGVGEAEDHVLDGITTSKALPCRGEKQREHEDASRRTEVTAVDGHKEHTHSESDRVTPPVAPLDFLRSPMHEDRNRCERDQPRHYALEGARRRDQQQQPTHDATKNRYDAEPTQPCGLTTELGPRAQH